MIEMALMLVAMPASVLDRTLAEESQQMNRELYAFRTALRAIAAAANRLLLFPYRSNDGARELRTIVTLLLAGGMLLAGGCGGGPPDVNVAPVSGVVRYKGVPIKGAQVKFSQSKCPIMAGGVTDDSGRFVLSSYKENDGAPVGLNRVAIYLQPSAAEAANRDEDEAKKEAAEAIEDPVARGEKMGELKNQRRAARANSRAQPESALPKRYASEETSNLSFTVEAGTENEFEIELTD